MTLVVATGVFELIHPGHLLFLQEARKLGTKLAVIVARDSTAYRRKHRSYVPENQRVEMVKALRMVDDAVLGDENDMFAPIMKLKPDILALGFDQDFDEKELTEEFKKRGLKTRITRLNAVHAGEFSSTKKIVEHIKRK